MVDTYKGGTLDDFANSMAADIEREFLGVWMRLHNEALPELGKQERRMFFVAIARGVLKHLKVGAWDSIVVTGLTSGENHRVLLDVE